MTILFIINGFASRVDATSGGELHCRKLIESIDKKKYLVKICTDKQYIKNKNIQEVQYITYPSLPFEHLFYNFFPMLFFIYLYRAIITTIVLMREQPNMIVTNSHFFYDIIPAFLIKKKSPAFTYLHHVINEQKRTNYSSIFTKYLEKISFYMINSKGIKSFTDSENIKEDLVLKYKFKSENIFVTKNGLDISEIRKINNDNNNYKKIFDLVYVGRLNTTKGIFDLIKIIREVKKSIPNISCAIVGDGKEMSTIQKQIKSYTLDENIKLHGYVSEINKIKIMKSAKAFIFPSHEEGWGIVIGEALACGLPVVLYKLNDIFEIWNKKVVWVSCFNISEFANKVTNLLSNKSKLASLSREGIKFSNTLNWTNILKKEMQILEKYI